jgi:hypothetical protein
MRRHTETQRSALQSEFEIGFLAFIGFNACWVLWEQMRAWRKSSKTNSQLPPNPNKGHAPLNLWGWNASLLPSGGTAEAAPTQNNFPDAADNVVAYTGFRLLYNQPHVSNALCYGPSRR